MENFVNADLDRLLEQIFKLPGSYDEGSYIRPMVVAVSNLAVVCQQLLRRLDVLENGSADDSLRLYLFFGPSPVYCDMIAVLAHNADAAKLLAASHESGLIHLYHMIELVTNTPAVWSLEQYKKGQGK